MHEFSGFVSEATGGGTQMKVIAKKAYLGFGLVLALLSGVSLVSFRTTTTFVIDTEEMIHSSQFLDTLKSNLYFVKDAEVAERGFILTGKESYLERYYAAKLKIPGLIQSLENSPVSNLEIDQIQRLKSLQEKLFSYFEDVIRTRRKSGFNEALQLHFTGKSQQLENSIRALSVQISETYENRIRNQKEKVSVSGKTNRLTIGIASLLTFLALFWAIIDIIKSQNELVEAKEGALKASEFKSAFLANMSHEIRTPINGVLGMARVLLDTKLNREQEDYTETIIRSGESLLSVINDILDISKVEAGKLEIEEVEFDLVQILNDLYKSFLHITKNKKINFVLNLKPNQHRYFMGDPNRIRQLATNLVGNAIKFTEKGRVEIKMRENNSSSGKSWLTFEISDSGIGLSPKEKSRLFKPFSQADSSTTRKYGGTGLGLSICKGLVELMKGGIGVNSKPGKGSTFWFKIPLERASSSKLKGAGPVQLSDATVRSRILIADDNEINQKAAILILKKFGIRADAVGNGNDVLHSLQKVHYDLVLMDCQMPDLDGYDTTAAIRKSKVHKIREIPVIAMTAGAVKGEKEKCLSSGMNAYVSKPIDIPQLMQTLEEYLAGRKDELHVKKRDS